MQLEIYQIDAFAENMFSGNPAAVVPLTHWLSAKTMQNIALENNLSETAFFIPTDKGFHIRWFTPLAEVALCGHATLAAAHVLFEHKNYKAKDLVFESRSGLLRVKKENDLIVLNFPVSPSSQVPIPKNINEAFDIQAKDCIKGRDDLMLIFEREKDVISLKPDFQKIIQSNTRGIICTAKSENFDFVSRFFAPAVGVNEDPVTGSAHTMLIPYWAEHLKKSKLIAKQVSKRGGILYCQYLNDRVEIGGKALTYLTGEITL